MNRADAQRDARKVFELIKAIKPLLAGQTAAVQGAVIADLLSLWLAGHIIPGDKPATASLHEEMIEQCVSVARKLIEPNYRMAIEPRLAQCAACGATQAFGQIRCTQCGEPLVFARH